MRLTINQMTALRVLRGMRSGGKRLPSARTDLSAPDPSPRRHWSTSALPAERLLLTQPPDSKRPVHVAVPNQRLRPRTPCISATTYGTGLPDGSFVDLGDGLSIPCPELLFVELAARMVPAVHALLGYELCGSFSRDPNDPRTGRATLGIAPVTSVERIGRFIDRCSNVRGTVAARRSLEYVADNAWSPAETVVAALVALPVHELGYGLGKVTLNARRAAPPELVKLGAATARIPDIEVDGLRVGFNYDGHDHLDLPSIARAATQEESDSAIDAVREKYVDDLRRNRELLATGRIVLPVTSEDLFRKNGLDAVMLEAALAEESLFGAKLPELRGTIASSALRRARQRLIWSLLPWDASLRYGREIAERERAVAESLSVEDAYVEF